MTEYRRDPVSLKWVLFQENKEYLNKLDDLLIPRPNLEDQQSCQFCSGKENLTEKEILAFRAKNSLANKSGWWIRVLPGKKFIVSEYEALARKFDDNGLLDLMNAGGSHELIIDTHEHGKVLWDLREMQIAEIFWAYRERYLNLRRDPGVKYIMYYKNCGINLLNECYNVNHSYSNIISFPVIPSTIKMELTGSKSYFLENDRCLFCDIVKEESLITERILFEDEFFIAFCPFAAKFPFEVWIIPKEHEAGFHEIKPETMSHFVTSLKFVLKCFKEHLDSPGFSLVLHTSPCIGDCSKYYHWHLEIIPSTHNFYSYQHEPDLYLNNIYPESAAKILLKR